MSDPQAETRAVAERYARRGTSHRYSLLRPDVWQTVQERQRVLLQMLVRHGATELPALRLTEVGCGAGGNLLELLRLGFDPAHLQGLELLPAVSYTHLDVYKRQAHGCVPILSDLPANRELVQHGRNGVILDDTQPLGPELLAPLLGRGDCVAALNHRWVAEHALFAPCVRTFVDRLRALTPATPTA